MLMNDEIRRAVDALKEYDDWEAKMAVAVVENGFEELSLYSARVYAAQNAAQLNAAVEEAMALADRIESSLRVLSCPSSRLFKDFLMDVPSHPEKVKVKPANFFSKGIKK